MHFYRELFRVGLDDRDVHDVRQAVAFSTPLGDSRFKVQIGATVGRSGDGSSQLNEEV